MVIISWPGSGTSAACTGRRVPVLYLDTSNDYIVRKSLMEKEIENFFV